ncbi:replication/maintenance protein RepL [Streptomyces sp. NPDC003016]
MLGEEGYSLVSNYFLRRVLPYCLMHRIISPLQAAVLSNMIGRQKKGLISATHAEIAEEIGVKRTSIGHPLKALCNKNLLRLEKRGTYQLNPTVAYNGNGTEQKNFLAELRALHLASGFPDDLDPELTLFPQTDIA